MIKSNHLPKLWAPQMQALQPNILIHMISEILFPHKIVTLGTILLLAVFLFLVMMISKMVELRFELLFLALITTILGTTLWVVGFTGYVGNIRA
jgi:hypothetical protein